MIALVVIGGAIIVFIAGWSLARVFQTPVEPPPVAASTAIAPTYQDVLGQQSTGIVITDREGGVEYQNAAAAAMAGTTVGVLVDEAISRHLERARNGSPGDETLELYGPPRIVVHIVARRLEEGRAVAFITDISDRRRIEQARTDFVANVSHELRTPIGALMVLAETLVDVDDPEVAERVVGRMQSEATRASRTIDDLLELSRIESFEESDDELVTVSDVVREATHRVAELAASREITVSTLDPVDAGGPRSASVLVLGDRRQLSSAVGNLVENAVKYSDEGATVQVRSRVDGAVVEISVVDDGPGIPRNDLDRVFERFYRVDRARSRHTGGTGLGLSIVRNVAERHGGSVAVGSVEGEGSTFVLRLPVAVADGDDIAPTEQNGTGVA